MAVWTLCVAGSAEEEKAAPAGDTQPAGTAVRTFTGEVREIVMLSKYAGKAIVVHFDARFVVRVKVIKPESKDMEAAGIELAYVIHSPSQTFAMSAEEAVGKVFTFRETETQQTGPSGRSRAAHWLKVTPVAAAQDSGTDEEKKK